MLKVVRINRIQWITLFGAAILSACGRGDNLVPSPSPELGPNGQLGAGLVTDRREPEDCRADETLIAVREWIPYAETTIIFNTIDGIRNLNVWFIEPDLDPNATQATVQENAELAIRRSAGLALELNSVRPCIEQLFHGVTLFAVDTNYNAWYIVGIAPSNIPDGSSLSEEDLAAVIENFNEGYLRVEAPDIFGSEQSSSASCTWPGVQADLREVLDFSVASEGSYYYIDNEGGAIWIQWTVPSLATNVSQIEEGFFTLLPAIDEAVSCLAPPFKTLWLLYVFTDGRAQLVAAIDGAAVTDEHHQMMIDLMEVVFPYRQ